MMSVNVSDGMCVWCVYVSNSVYIREAVCDGVHVCE